MRIIVPFAPGGTTDALARLLAQSLSESLGQAVVVENRAGGNTVIATETVVRAAPDGHTLGMIATPFVVNTTLMKQLPYDPVSDIQPLTLLGRIELVLVVHPSVEARAPKDLVSIARSRPINFGSGGNGTASHLAGELFKLRTKGAFTHISYRGGGPAMNDLLGGQTQFMFNAVASTLPFIRSGKFRALATTGAKRSSATPEVPTMFESGFPDFEMYEWFGLVLPAATPPEVGQRLLAEIGKFERRADMQARTDAMGLELVQQTPQEFRAYLDRETKRIREIVLGAQVKID